MPLPHAPLPAPRYANALAQLQKEQAAITSRFAVSNFRSKERDMQLQQLLDRATQPPAPGEGIMRVMLARTRDQLASLLPIDTAINTITEGAGGGTNGGAGGDQSGAPSRSASQSQL